RVFSVSIHRPLRTVRDTMFLTYLLRRSSDDGSFTCRLQITLHSVLASRIMFNLRKSSYCIQTGTTMDSIIFNDNAFDPASHSQSNGFELSGRRSRV
ncbi:hypothetical protein J3R82DRAFT_2139, partial [Butyriboletus roseoflavus]